eukprot:CAMPEP_0116009214 /NCGR_PEP_ID=MMETSP0321-20121206/3304_1 /TAXON_ID=163516 /ORGANISM="Leptocylindrus danicus var. danicus, Strain B650" /LENGTH=324 /DNA_ID=CAMNT_0003478143 /DNA_START=125 /DNA_END=1099 /DNA_ORIENTATION=-
MGEESNGLRQRRNKKSKKTKSKNATHGTTKDTPTVVHVTNDTTTTKTTTTSKSATQHPSKWSAIANAKDYPIIAITTIVMLPYALYNAYLYLHMGLYRPRLPAIQLHDPRQVLIVGTISSGTSQVTVDLKRMLNLEIGHENSETKWSFVRDGTLSRFHGIRYIPRLGRALIIPLQITAAKKERICFDRLSTNCVENSARRLCIEAAGNYVVEYNEAMITAQSHGYLDENFHVEDMTPCDVAELAGFVDESALHVSSRDLVLKACSDVGGKALQLMKSTENSYNKGLVSLDWDDLLGGKHGSKKKEGDRNLQKRAKKLARNLGYQ